MPPLHWGDLELVTVLQVLPPHAEQNGRTISLDQLATHLPTQHRPQLAFFARNDWLGAHQDPHVFFCKADFQLCGPNTLVVSPQVQGFALPLGEPHEVPVKGPFYSLSRSLWMAAQISHTSATPPICGLCKLAEGVLRPASRPLLKMLNSTLFNCTWGATLATGLHTINYCPLSLTIHSQVLPTSPSAPPAHKSTEGRYSLLFPCLPSQWIRCRRLSAW